MTYEELKEILLKEKPSIILKEREDELFDLIPELKYSKGFNQNNPWHIYDVLEHTYHVLDGVDSDLVLRLTALFHDIGKPYTYTETNGVGRFTGHWDVSKKIFLEFAEKHNIDEPTKDLVSKLIFLHDLNVDDMSDKQKDSLSTSEILKLFKIKRADILAQNPEKHEEVLDRYELDEEELLMGREK